MTTDMLLMSRAIAARAGSDPSSLARGESAVSSLKVEFPRIATAAHIIVQTTPVLSYIVCKIVKYNFIIRMIRLELII